MKCQTCSSKRILSISAKSNELNHIEDHLNGYEYEGYIPNNIGVDGGDSLEFSYCLDCGQIQGTWPLPESAFERGELDQDEDDDEYDPDLCNGRKKKLEPIQCIPKVHILPTDYLAHDEEKYVAKLDGLVDIYLTKWVMEGKMRIIDKATADSLLAIGYFADESLGLSL